jgi:hypothetical protein
MTISEILALASDSSPRLIFATDEEKFYYIAAGAAGSTATWIANGAGGDFLPLAGGTITGDLSVTGTATLPHIHGGLAGNLYIHVKNTSGGALTKGTPVYIIGNGGASDRVEVAAADNTDEAKMPAVALLSQDLANNAEGDATVIGELTHLNTAAYTLNQELYVGVGGLVGTAPASGYIQSVGIVARVHASTGVLVVNMQNANSGAATPASVEAAIDEYSVNNSLTLIVNDYDTVSGYALTAIGDSQFANTPIKAAQIGSSVTSIGNNAFQNCSSLTSITIGNSVTSIGNYAFQYCSVFTSITIPDGVTSIGYSAFYGCVSLTSITIPDGVTSSIGDYAFYYCYSLTSVTIGDSVTSIDYGAFYGCSSLTSITIPDSVTNIGNYAFYGCTSLTSVTIGDSVTSIGNYAFYNCSSLTSITIGNSVTSIGSSAFSYCSSFTSITIPDSVTNIGNYAFSDCTSLATINSLIPKTVWDAGFALSATNPLTIHVLAGDASWTAGTGLSVAGNTNVTVVKDL